MMEWGMVLPRSWLPIATGLFGSALILLVFRKTLLKLLGTCECSKGRDDDAEEEDEEQYVKIMARIVGAADAVPYIPEPTKLLDFLYIGSEYDAKQVSKLEEIGITHIINTVDGHVGGQQSRLELYEGRFKYLNFLAQDRWNYIIMQHFNDVYEFIEDARLNEGKVFIHCSMGINRSGALAAGYIIVHKQQGPLTTVQYIKQARGCTLTNSSFQEQVVHFANRRGLLSCDRHFLESKEFQEYDRARESLQEKIRNKDEKIKLLFKEINS